MTASRQPYRSKSFVWKAIFALVVLINYSAMIYVFHHLSSSSSTAITTSPGAAEYPSNNFFSTAKDDDKRILDNDNTMMNYQTNEETTHNNPPPRILLAGMAFSDNTISDYALSFLIHSACTHHIHTHILLATRDTNTPLTKKIEVLSTHYFQPLPSPVDERQQLPPSCRNFIHVEVAPSEEELVNMTKSYHNENHSGNIFLQEDTPNNPWNEQNRIARIKRSREYQRQLVIRMLNNSNNNNDNNNNNLGGVDWTTSQDAVIGVLDLDLFDYPSPEQLIDSAREYIVMTKNNQNDNGGGGGGNTKHEHSHSGRQQQQQQRQHHTGMKYHAICSNGLFVMKSRGYNGYRRRYYDTFSTILLPNSWLHVDRERPRGSLVGEDVTMAKMNQDKTLQWILKEGRRSSSSQLPSQSLSISGNNNNNDSSSSNNNNKDNNNHGESQGEKQEVQYQYVPVPVRSCFNGLTLYRADVWLEPQCRYDSYHKDDDAYLSKRYQHACEHIVFHECLRRVLSEREGSTGGGGDGFNIAVQPDLTTLWHYLS
jgi:hypothetical protein